MSESANDEKNKEIQKQRKQKQACFLSLLSISGVCSWGVAGSTCYFLYSIFWKESINISLSIEFIGPILGILFLISAVATTLCFGLKTKKKIIDVCNIEKK
ncbi:MAG: hypothetical protein LBJ93_00265 [Clostridiales bacterium]|jgi:hypothetical protein|nr:hypothetical protein [Clostridiales bacterium]